MIKESPKNKMIKDSPSNKISTKSPCPKCGGVEGLSCGICGGAGFIGEKTVAVWEGGEKVGVEKIKRRRHWLPGIGNWGQR